MTCSPQREVEDERHARAPVPHGDAGHLPPGEVGARLRRDEVPSDGGDRGGVDAATQLLHGPPSDGFTTLWEKGRLDLSVEYHVLDPQFSRLFTEEERGIARDRLEQFGFDVEQ